MQKTYINGLDVTASFTPSSLIIKSIAQERRGGKAKSKLALHTTALWIVLFMGNALRPSHKLESHLQSWFDSPWTGHSCACGILSLQPDAKVFRNNLGFTLSNSQLIVLIATISVDQRGAG